MRGMIIISLVLELKIAEGNGIRRGLLLHFNTFIFLKYTFFVFLKGGLNASKKKMGVEWSK